MSTPAELMALGVPALQANALGSDIATAVVAAGTSSQTTATQLTASFNEIITAAANSGVILTPYSDVHVVKNGGVGTVLVYPPVGGYMNGTQNASFSVTNGKSGTFHRSGNRYIGILSA